MDELMRQYKMNKDDSAMWKATLVESKNKIMELKICSPLNTVFVWKTRKNKKNYFGFSELLNHQAEKNIIHRLFNNNNNHNLFRPNSDITLDSQNPLLWLQSLR